MTATAAFSERRELAHRTGDGIEISLFWSKPSDRITIAVVDTRTDETLEFEVAGSAALDAFNHPFAYAAVLQHHGRAVSRAGQNTLTTNTSR